MRGNYISFKGTNLTVVEGMHQFISPAWYCLLSIIVADLMLGVVWYTNIFEVWYTMCCSFVECYFIKIFSKDVSREFDEFRVNTHLCKVRCWYLQYSTWVFFFFSWEGSYFFVFEKIYVSFFLHYSSWCWYFYFGWGILS